MNYRPICGEKDVYVHFRYDAFGTGKKAKVAGCYDCWWFGEKSQLMNERQKIVFDRKHKLIKIGYENKKWLCK